MHAPYSAKMLSSLDELQQYGQRWNELWDSSQAYEPTSRWETTALWVRSFEDPSTFRAAVIEDNDGRAVAALAFLRKPKLGFQTLVLPSNEWAKSGELMIADDVDPKSVVPLLVEQLKSQGDVLDFDRIQFEMPRWQLFSDYLTESGHIKEISRIHRVGLINIGNDWDGYFQCLSGNHRSAVRRSQKKANKQGDLQLVRRWNPSIDEVTAWMEESFRIEHQGWKGPNGTSIVAAGLQDYFLHEALNARNSGMLDLWTLQLDGQTIAYEYCHHSKGHCLSYKIGYDEKFKALGPGRLLRKMQLEQMTNGVDQPDLPATLTLDTMGLLCKTKAKWTTGEYRMGRLVSSLSFSAKLLVQSKTLLRQIKRRIQPQDDKQTESATTVLTHNTYPCTQQTAPVNQ